MKTRYIKPLTEVTKVKLRVSLCQVSGNLQETDFSFETEEAKINNNDSEGSWGNLWEE